MEFTSQPRLTHRHEWRLGDFVVSNNYGVMHRVAPSADDTGRSMHSAKVSGDQRLGRPLREIEMA